MGSLSNLYISQSYTSLIHLGNDGPISNLLPGQFTDLEDGLGNSINISVNANGDISASGNIYGANITGSQIDTGSLVSVSSFNSYTSSTNIRLNNLENTSASVNVSISNLNSATQSLNTSITNLNASSASQQISINALNTFSSSANQRLTAIESVSGSWITESETSSFARTNITNTFTESQIISGAITASAARIANLNYPTADGIYTKQVLQTNAAGTLSFGDVNTLYENIRNGETTNLTKGTAVYISGSQGDTPIVYRADADSPLRMPVTFVVAETIAPNTVGRGITLGLLSGYSTSEPVGAELYANGNGTLTSTRPTGSASIVQPIGIITKTGSGGILNILNPGPNSLPNIQKGYAWVGDGSNQPIAVATSSFGSSTDISQLNAFTASQLNINSGYNNFTSSQQSFNSSATASISQLLSFSSSLDTNFVTEAELAAATGSLINQINTKLNTSSFNSYTQSNDQRVNSLEINSASVNISISNLNSTTESLNISVSNLNASSASQQQSIDALNAITASFLTSSTDISHLNQFTASQLNINSGYNTFTSSANQRLGSLESATSSYVTESETSSFARYDVSNPWSANQTFTNITAVSASFTYVQTTYETSSVIYSSGSNQFGDDLSDVQTLSGSVKVQGSLTVNGTPVLTSSVDISGLVTTASFNAYTQSNDQRVSSLESNSASVNVAISNLNASSASQQISIDALNVFTASQSTASLVTSIDNLNTFSASALVSISNINTTTASLNTSVANINTFTQSANQRLGSLEAATSSYVTEAESGSFLITASFDNGTRNLTFTKGDNSTFNVNIPDVSGSAGDFVTTASFNSYTSSNDQKVNSLINATGSYATTGSNIFSGNQTVSGFVSASNGFRSGPNTTALEIGDGSNVRFISGSSYYNVQLVPGVGDIAFSRDGVSNVKTFVLAGAAGNVTNFQNNAVEFQSSVGNVSFAAPIQIQSGVNSNVDITGSLKISSTFDAPLAQGFVWVGDSAGRTTTVATSSFGGTTDLGPLNSFTASQYVSNSYFATTGSNNFIGVETINSVAGTGQGEVYLLADSGSLVIGNSTATPTYAALSHLSSSQLNGNTNLIFKTNTNTADTIISGSSNIFTNPSAPTAGFKRYMTGGNIAIGGNGAAVPQISGSMAWSPTIANNLFAASANPLTWRGPASASTSTVLNNVIAGGAINLGTSAANHFERAAIGTTITGNLVAGGLSAIASKTTLSASINIASNIVGGGVTLAMDSSSISFNGNSVQGTLNVNNSYFPSTTGSQVITSVNGGLYIGNHTIYASGSNTTFTGAPGRTITNGVMLGTNNVISASLNGDLAQVASTSLLGQGLVVVGSNSRVAGASAADWGSVFVGRWNDFSGNKGGTGETVFAVGTGTGASTRKTGFLIDSGSNMFVEGTLNVSGSTTITGSLTLSSSAAIELNVIGNSTFTGSVAGNVVSSSITSNTASIDFNLANYFEVTSSVTPLHLNVINITPGRTSTLIISASASSSITFSPNVAQPLGNAYSGSLGSIDILSFVAFNTSKVNLVATKALV